MSDGDKEFEVWMTGLREYAKRMNAEFLIGDDDSAWRDYFDDEYDPSEAFNENASYAD